MTAEQKEKLHDLVENLVFKGVARSLMIVATVLLGLVTWNINRLYATVDGVQRDAAQLKLDVAQFSASVQTLVIRQDNDRTNTVRLIDNVDGRATILSNRISKVEDIYAPKSEVAAGFTYLGQRLDAIDMRVKELDGRIQSLDGRGRTSK